MHILQIILTFLNIITASGTTCGNIKSLYLEAHCCKNSTQTSISDEIAYQFATDIVGNVRENWSRSLTNMLAKAHMYKGFMYMVDFNMFGAIMEFIQAQSIEPDNPMPYVFHALASSSNWNSEMMVEYPDDTLARDYLVGGYTTRIDVCTDNMRKALERKNHTNISVIDRAMIEAMAVRCNPDSLSPTENRSAYSDAMVALYDANPLNVDVMVQTMYALAYKLDNMREIAFKRSESGCVGVTEGQLPPIDVDIRDSHTGPYIQRSHGNRYVGCRFTQNAIDAILLAREVQKLDPLNPEASHMLIHLMEQGHYLNSVRQEAEILLTSSVMGAHHMHMPAHIFCQTDEVYKCFLAARESCARSELYFAQNSTRVNNAYFYKQAYGSHNYVFVLPPAYALGFQDEALRLAELAVPYNLMDCTLTQIFTVPASVLIPYGLATYTPARAYFFMIQAEYSNDLSSVVPFGLRADGDYMADYEFEYVQLLMHIEANNKTLALQALTAMQVSVDNFQNLDWGDSSTYIASFTFLGNKLNEWWRKFINMRVEMARAVYRVVYDKDVVGSSIEALKLFDDIAFDDEHIGELPNLWVPPSYVRGEILLARGEPQAAYEACYLGLTQRPNVNHMKDCMNRAIDAGNLTMVKETLSEDDDNKFVKLRSTRFIMDSSE